MPTVELPPPAEALELLPQGERFHQGLGPRLGDGGLDEGHGAGHQRTQPQCLYPGLLVLPVPKGQNDDRRVPHVRRTWGGDLENRKPPAT